jgi:hypothetical protein
MYYYAYICILYLILMEYLLSTVSRTIIKTKLFYFKARVMQEK